MKNLIQHLNSFKYQSLLLLAAAIWGLGTVCVKNTVDALPPFWLVGIRFFGAGVLFCIIFAPQIVKVAKEGRFFEHFKISWIFGLTMIAGYMANALGLTATTAAKSSFLTGLYCVLVPFIAWVIMKRRPTVFNISAAFLCLIGVGFVSIAGQTDFTIGWGDAVTLGSAFLLGIQVAVTSKYAPGRNMMAITAMQFLFGGGCSLVVAFFTEPMPQLSTFADPEMLANLAYLILFATCAALLLQNIGLVKVPPSSGALLLSFESVFGVVFSVLMLHEALTLSMMLGFALIFSAVLVSEWLPSSGLVKRARSLRRRSRTLRRRMPRGNLEVNVR